MKFVSKAPVGSYRHAQEHLLWATGFQLLLAGLQIWLGYELLSLAVQASGIYSFVRGFSCLAGLMGLSASVREEKGAGLIASGWGVLLPPVILVLASWEIISMGYERLVSGAHSARFEWSGLLFLGGIFFLSVLASALESKGTMGVRNRLYRADGNFSWTHFWAVGLAMVAVGLASRWSLLDNFLAIGIVGGALYVAGDIVLRQLRMLGSGKDTREPEARVAEKLPMRTDPGLIHLEIDPGRPLNPMERSALEKKAIVVLEEELPLDAKIRRATMPGT